MTSRPQYSFARRVGRATAWLEESEIAALYRDRFRLAEEHRDKVLKVLELGSEWTRRDRPATADRIWLEVAPVPSAPAELFVDPAHISGLSDFFKEQSKPGALPHPVFKGFKGQTPEVLRGRLRLDPRMNSTALEAYADGLYTSVRRWAGTLRPLTPPPCSTSRSWNTGCSPCSMQRPGIPDGPAPTATSMFWPISSGRSRSSPAQCPWWGGTFRLATRGSAQTPRRFTQLPP